MQKLKEEPRKEGEGRTMINNVQEGEMFPTLEIESKIKTFHTINEANCSTTHKWMILSDTAYQLLPVHKQ